jgi:hypothetical protein
METPSASDLDIRLTRSLEHAKQGHANVQHVISFIDTKTGILMTYSFAAIAVPLWLMKSSVENVKTLEALWSLATANPVVSLVVAFSASCWVCCVTFCMESLTPSSPPKPGRLMLFPHFTEAEREKAEKTYRKQMEDANWADLTREYSSQLAALGVICDRKMRNHRKACLAFRWQLIFPGVLHLFLVCCVSFKKWRRRKNLPRA